MQNNTQIIFLMRIKIISNQTTFYLILLLKNMQAYIVDYVKN